MAWSVPPLRPFGRPEDLDLRLEGEATPDAVTGLLAQCGTEVPPRAWWHETVGGRIAALVRLAAISDEAGAFVVPLQCARPGCGSRLEIPLPLETTEEALDASARIAVRLADREEVVVRPPVGEDQRAWHGGEYASRDDAVGAMLERLVIEGRFSASDREAVATIASVLADRDPLVAFTVRFTCPACGTAAETDLDLERAALDRLVRLQHALVRDVHVLASAYGWTEAEVLAVPRRRRARYRALIDEAVP